MLDDETSSQTTQTPGAEGAADPATAEVPAPPRRPRRRAASRPAGPPQDVGTAGGGTQIAVEQAVSIAQDKRKSGAAPPADPEAGAASSPAADASSSPATDAVSDAADGVAAEPVVRPARKRASGTRRTRKTATAPPDEPDTAAASVDAEPDVATDRADAALAPAASVGGGTQVAVEQALGIADDKYASGAAQDDAGKASPAEGPGAALAATAAAGLTSDAPGGSAPRKRASRAVPPLPLFQPPDPELAVPAAASSVDSSVDSSVGSSDDGGADSGDGGEGAGTRRRRSRGGRNRRKSGGSSDGSTDASSTALAGDGSDAGHPATDTAATGQDATAQGGATGPAADSGDSDGDSGGTSRRRRRRRRGDADSDDEPPAPRARASRASKDTVTAVEGSTRIEAKKQRRREGREAGRRRPPILTESEFLARRESVERVMTIRQQGETTQIAVLEDGMLVEHYVALESQSSLIGNVYLGRVQNVLPSMEAAFIDIGKSRNAVLYAGEVNWSLRSDVNAPRRIENALKPGQTVLVQVTKDPVGHKGARLTSQISLAGRFLVYVPGGGTSGISRKLPDTERNRLKNLLKDMVPEEAGVIIRTAAEGASEEELTRDVTRLTARWDDIQKKSKNGSAPQLLYAEPDTTLKVVRDLFTEDFTKMVIAGDDAWDMVEGYVSYVAPDLVERLERYDGEEDLFASYRVDEQIAKALERKVWLPSGGSLVIDRTEAMTVVDVNTGKFTGSGGNLEETVTKNNLEAAEEIVRQLRLRDVGGIIVVDFIDMVLESNRDMVLRRLVECLGRDRTRHQVAEVTSLGLVQMTRKRIGTGLVEAFSVPCEVCHGRGVVISGDPVQPGRGSDGHGAHGHGGSGGQGSQSGNGRHDGAGGRTAKRSSNRRRGRSADSGSDSASGVDSEASAGDGSSAPPAETLPSQPADAPAPV